MAHQSFVYLQASRFAATQVVPTAIHLMHWAAGTFTSEPIAVRYLPAHPDILAVRIGQLTAEDFHLLDSQP